MPEIRNELHLGGSQPDIEKLINSVVTPNYPMLDFSKILPVSSRSRSNGKSPSAVLGDFIDCSTNGIFKEFIELSNKS